MQTFMKQHPEVFTFDDANELETQNEADMEFEQA